MWLHVRKGYIQNFALDIAKKKNQTIIDIKPHKYEFNHIHPVGIRVMMFNATFKNISVTISFIGGENHQPAAAAASLRQTLSHDVVSSTPRYEWDGNSLLCGDRH